MSLKRMFMVFLALSALLFLANSLLVTDQTVNAQMILKEGSQHDLVREIQDRLSYLGFYKSEIDGVFGPQTMKATKHFQEQFGLQVDGVIGSESNLALQKATPNWYAGINEQAQGNDINDDEIEDGQNGLSQSSHHGLSENDIKLMANAVYGEARGEPEVGQVAVAAVILNRIKADEFPDSVSGVIFEPRAFTAVADGQIWLEPDDQARKSVLLALNGQDPSGGCLYYFNPVTATSDWIWTRPQVKTIGKHIFCK